MGIEPTSQAWEARVLPLNDTRMNDVGNAYAVLSGVSTILCGNEMAKNRNLELTFW